MIRAGGDSPMCGLGLLRPRGDGPGDNAHPTSHHTNSTNSARHPHNRRGGGRGRVLTGSDSTVTLQANEQADHVARRPPSPAQAPPPCVAIRATINWPLQKPAPPPANVPGAGRARSRYGRSGNRAGGLPAILPGQELRRDRAQGTFRKHLCKCREAGDPGPVGGGDERGRDQGATGGAGVASAGGAHPEAVQHHPAPALPGRDGAGAAAESAPIRM